MNCTDELECLAGIDGRKKIAVEEEDGYRWEYDKRVVSPARYENPEKSHMPEWPTDWKSNRAIRIVSMGAKGQADLIMMNYAADKLKETTLRFHKDSKWKARVIDRLAEEAAKGEFYLRLSKSEYEKLVGDVDYITFAACLRGEDFAVDKVKDSEDILVFWG